MAAKECHGNMVDRTVYVCACMVTDMCRATISAFKNLLIRKKKKEKKCQRRLSQTRKESTSPAHINMTTGNVYLHTYIVVIMHWEPKPGSQTEGVLSFSYSHGEDGDGNKEIRRRPLYTHTHPWMCGCTRCVFNLSGTQLGYLSISAIIFIMRAFNY